MAGAGYKLFATGDVLTAAQVNTYLMQQSVMVFASATARNTALSGVLSEGMVAYLTDTNDVTIYDGAAWNSFGAGDITGVTAGTGLSGGGTSGAVTLSINTATTADLTTAQTLTNKTLTSPVLTTPSISNIDAKGDLLAGTADNTISRLAVGANNTVLTADSAEATGMKWATSTSATYTNYTPTFTNFTLGNGTIDVARYAQSGKLITGYGKVTLGSTSVMGTDLIFTLPVTASSNVVVSPIGQCQLTDTGNLTYYGFVLYATTTTAKLVIGNSNGVYFTSSTIQSTQPMTWISTDTFTFNFTYEAA